MAGPHCLWHKVFFMALLSILGIVTCSQQYHESTSDGVDDYGTSMPLPMHSEDLSSLNSLMLALRQSAPQSPTNKNHHHLAVSRAKSRSRAYSDGASSWLSLVVHFTVPVSSATIAALAEVAQGAVTASMGSGLFAVSCRLEALNRIRRFPGLASVRVRAPADKRAALALPDKKQATNSSSVDNGLVHVHCLCTWPSQSCASRISSVLEAHSCVATSSRAPHHKVMGVCHAQAAAAASAAVAELVDVDWVEVTG
jgi:hypothetical protein